MKYALALIIVLLIAPALAAGASNVPRWNAARPPAAVPEYLVVCREKAVETVAPLVRHRIARGLSAAVLTAEDAATHFDDENKTANQAIRAAIHALRKAGKEDGPRLRFVLVAGTANPRDQNDLMVPTWIVPARFRGKPMFSPRLAGDNPYATPPESLAPDLAIGRLPARTLDELKTMVAKTIEAESKPAPGAWRRRIDLVAGQGGYGAVLDGLIEQVVQMVMTRAAPYRYRAAVTYANPASPYCYDPARFGEYVIERLNAGPAVFLYAGHGSTTGFDTFRWRGEWVPIVTAHAVEALNVPHARTLVVTLCCWTGRFDGFAPAIGERLLASPKGPSATIGASRISQPYANALLGLELTRHLAAAPAPTVGEALLRAKRGLLDAEADELERMLDLVAMPVLGLRAPSQQRIDQVTMINLLGDPALANPLVRGRARLTAPEAVDPGEAFDVEAAFDDLDAGRARFELVMSRDRTRELPDPLPENHPEAGDRMIARHAAANNKLIAHRETNLKKGHATARLSMPEDAAPGVYYVRVYAWNDKADATGAAMVRVIK